MARGDLEDHRHVAMPFGRTCRRAAVGVAGPEETRAEHFAVAVLEILPLDAPGVGHDVHLLGARLVPHPDGQYIVAASGRPDEENRMPVPLVDPPSYHALVLDERIHASLYTDPRIFADEMEKIFHRGWVFVGHDSEIPQPGDFVTRRVGAQPVLMVRGR